MTTFRLLRQSNRASRFAQVTVEVAASSRPEIEVATTVAGRYRREAELGVRWALARLPAATSVTVTDVVTTDVDTSAGDVYEAAAHAVWQALGIKHDVPYVGFSDPGIVTTWLQEMLGRRLDAVTEARHWYEQRREPDAESLLHAWMYFDHADPVCLHGRGDQFLLSKEAPYRSYDVDEHGETRVGPAQHPDVLSGFVGARLTDGAVILGHDGPTVCAGLVLRFDNGDLTIGTLGDEWVLAAGSIPASGAPYWTTQRFALDGSP